MPWQKMSFRGELVSVLVDDEGRAVLGRDGRAEMKYRENDPKSYRPDAANLSPVPSTDTRPDAGPAHPTMAKRSTPLRGAAARVEPPDASSGSATTYHVWTDGACSGNPGPMGIGVVVIAGSEREELGEYLGSGTNNIAELVAIERGLQIVANRMVAAGQSGTRVRVYSDSSYAIGLLEKSWKAKANQDLVARIRRLLAAFPGKLEFVKVRGHAGVPENERCDVLGREAILRGRNFSSTREQKAQE
jgi:ribonuclease HI